jgi:hypothetical protein
MSIALYLRVSTDRQTTDSQALELRDYCKRRGGGAEATRRFHYVAQHCGREVFQPPRIRMALRRTARFAPKILQTVEAAVKNLC